MKITYRETDSSCLKVFAPTSHGMLMMHDHNHYVTIMGFIHPESMNKEYLPYEFTSEKFLQLLDAVSRIKGESERYLSHIREAIEELGDFLTKPVGTSESVC